MNDDRRTNHIMRAAMLRLRLVESLSAEYLPSELMQELTAAIDGVVDLLRKPDPTDPDQAVFERMSAEHQKIIARRLIGR